MTVNRMLVSLSRLPSLDPEETDRTPHEHFALRRRDKKRFAPIRGETESKKDMVFGEQGAVLFENGIGLCIRRHFQNPISEHAYWDVFKRRLHKTLEGKGRVTDHFFNSDGGSHLINTQRFTFFPVFAVAPGRRPDLPLLDDFYRDRGHSPYIRTAELHAAGDAATISSIRPLCSGFTKAADCRAYETTDSRVINAFALSLSLLAPHALAPGTIRLLHKLQQEEEMKIMHRSKNKRGKETPEEPAPQFLLN